MKLIKTIEEVVAIIVPSAKGKEVMTYIEHVVNSITIDLIGVGESSHVEIASSLIRYAIFGGNEEEIRDPVTFDEHRPVRMASVRMKIVMKPFRPRRKSTDRSGKSSRAIPGSGKHSFK